MTPNKHYIVMAGMHGCIPNYCGSCETYAIAVDDLADMHELGRTRKAKLRKEGYLELNLARDGNEYCEITECDCDHPYSHNSD